MVEGTIADIPGYEKTWLKFSTHVGSACSSIGRVSKLYERESNLILRIANQQDVDELSRLVRIPRLIGMRPGNCEWSILMVIDHVMRFNDWVLGTIQSLQAGSDESMLSDRFYPKADIGLECIDDYQEQVWRYSGFLGLQKNLRLGGRAAMPSRTWLGSLNAFQWHCVAARHTWVHRRQVQKILAVAGVV